MRGIRAVVGAWAAGERAVRWVLMIAAMAFMAGCDAPPVPLVDVCDGSDDVVLSVAYSPGGFSFGERLTANGYHFMYITGDCRAWFSDFGRSWTAAYEASFTPSEAAAVAKRVGYGLWSKRYGDHYSDDISDGPVTYYLDREGLVQCYPECSYFQDDEVLRTMDLFSAIDAARELGAELMSGPGRIAVFPTEYGGEAPSWPADLPALDELAIQPGEPLASVPLDVEASRRVRSYFVSLEERDQLGAAVFEYEGNQYQVFFRDSLPIEGPDGRVISEWPAPGPL